MIRSAAHRVLDPQQSLLLESEDQRGRELLRHGSDTEPRARCIGAAAREIGPAERALEQDLALVDDEGRAVEEPQIMEGPQVAFRAFRAGLRLDGGREPDEERRGETVPPG